MDWTTALTLPTAWFLIVAALSALACLTLVLECRQQWQRRALLLGIASSLGLALALLLTLWLLLSALALRGYRPFPSSGPLISIESRILVPGRWALDLVLPDGSQQTVAVNGDDFQLSLAIADWHAAGLSSRLPPLYRLGDIGTHHDASPTAGQPATRRTTQPLATVSALDLLRLQGEYPGLLPGLHARHESSAYLPLVDHGTYVFTLDAQGHLTGHPDIHTSNKLGRPL